MAGERCAVCGARETRIAGGEWPRVPCFGPSPECCKGTGYTRQPHDLREFLPVSLGGGFASVEHSAGLLIASVEGILMGVGPVRGPLPSWVRESDGAWCRSANQFEYVLRVDENGWCCALDFDRDARGPETGEQGKVCADRAALAHRYALMNDCVLALPEAGHAA